MRNRLTMLLLASVLAILSGTAAAAHVDVDIGVPLVAPAPVAVAPAPAPYPPGYYGYGPPPGYYAPGPDFIWVNGFWDSGHQFHRGHWRHR
jgi:hypothetical protein